MDGNLKDWLGYENARNKKWAQLYTDIMKRALVVEQQHCEVLIGHHLTFEIDGVIASENEIPSADTLIFDHLIMQRVFGRDYLFVMLDLALTEVGQRDARLATHFAHVVQYGEVEHGSVLRQRQGGAVVG